MQQTDWKGNLPPDPDETILIAFENGQMTFADLSIGVGNCLVEDYEDTEGKQQNGMRCGFWPVVTDRTDEQLYDYRVYPGMVFDYLGYRIRVHRIVEQRDGTLLVEAGVKQIEA